MLFQGMRHSPLGGVRLSAIVLAGSFVVSKGSNISSSLLGSNKFSSSARRLFVLYDFYRRFTTAQKSDKPAPIAVEKPEHRLFLSSTPPYIF